MTEVYNSRASTVIFISVLITLLALTWLPIDVYAWESDSYTVEPDTYRQSISVNADAAYTMIEGDRGQYYTQVSPFLLSTVHLFNSGETTSRAILIVRNDVGLVAREEPLTIEAGHQVDIPLSRFNLHGLFHGTVQVVEGPPLAVGVSSQETLTGRETQPGFGPVSSVYSRYQAIPLDQTGIQYAVENLLRWREGSDHFDAEIVVQNLSTHQADLKITACAGAGGCVQNSDSFVEGAGRRVFLLSQLVDQDSAYSVSIESQPDRPIALISHAFQVHESGQPEFGARWLELRDVYATTSTQSRQGTIPSGGHQLYLPSIAQKRADLNLSAWMQSIPSKTDWALPFLAAPNLFNDKPYTHPYGIGFPNQGNRITGRGLDAWPDFQQFSWYNWGGNWAGMRMTASQCHEDPDFIPMAWWPDELRNSVASSCSGRPLFAFNELVDYRLMMEKNGTSLPTWTAENTARTLYTMRQWPGELYCCGHLERQYMPVDKISADSTDYATMNNIAREYGRLYDRPLPLDGIHIHTYLDRWHVDHTTLNVAPGSIEWMAERMRLWARYSQEAVGPDAPIIVSEFGVLSSQPNTQQNRREVQSGLCALNRTIRENLGEHLRRMYYFDFYWGGEKDPLPAMWLVSSQDGSYALDEVNDTGQLYLSLATTWPEYPAACQ